MGQYKYSAISRSGEKVSGMVEGFSELDAVTRIKETCDVVLKVQEVSGKSTGFLNFDLGGNKLNAKAFTVMCQQFAIILKAGIPISRAVHLIADKTTDMPLKRMLVEIAQDVEAGRSLATSFEERGGKLLPGTFVETVRAGEESGSIDNSFASLAEHYDKQTKMKGKVKGALAYPIFVLVIAVIVVIVLMVMVIPRLTEVFSSYGTELPGITKSLIAVSEFFQHNIIIIVVVLVVGVLAFKFYGNTEGGRLNLAKLGLKLPVFGNINELNAASQFANSMVTMLGAGLPLNRAISITAKVLDNYYMSTEIGKLTQRLEEGHSLGASMRDQDLMPDILVDMVNVGEETGEMEETLDTIAKFYDNELETAISDALAKLEPAMLIAVAGIAGYVVLAMYIGIFQMYSAM